MRIASYTLGMESTSTYTQKATYKQSVVGGQLVGNSANMLGGFAGLFDTEVLQQEDGNTTNQDSGESQTNELSDLYNRWLDEKKIPGVKSVNNNPRSDSLSALDKFRSLCMKYIYELLFGNRKKAKDMYDEAMAEDNTQNSNEAVLNLTIREESSYEEYQSCEFSTVGKVINSEGKEIDFNLSFSMSRSFQQTYNVTFNEAVNLCDPLVINLDTDCTEVSDQKFFFDLDCDGEEEEISYFKAGSGMLALDKNNDGKINDGSELFGTKSGDGFRDLAKYDEDHNGWIDENDSIWSQLKIWCKNDDGTDTLYTLSDKDVGAICLERVVTNYDYKDESNSTNARLRSSGVFLYENGNVGTIQQVDLAR